MLYRWHLRLLYLTFRRFLQRLRHFIRRFIQIILQVHRLGRGEKISRLPARQYLIQELTTRIKNSRLALPTIHFHQIIPPPRALAAEKEQGRSAPKPRAAKGMAQSTLKQYFGPK